jgi:toxin CcdB
LAVLGQSVFANPMEMLTLRSKQLSEPLAVLPERDQDSIIRAIDEMISRA